jgi:precorrin-2 dehydrogenase / sirohydrochlorin ferrochelatase
VKLRDLHGAKLVFCATGHSHVDRKMAIAARRRGALVNCASAPELGNFILPAVVRRGLAQVALSTGGASPALARKIAQEVAANLGLKIAPWTKLLQELRPLVLAKVPPKQRPAVWKHLTADKLGDMVNAGRMSDAKKFALMKIEQACSRDIPSRRRTRFTK